MSSDEEIGGPSETDDRNRHGPGVTKRRKLMRACDFCRRKKTKCDSTVQSGKTCSNCRTNSRECTFVEDSEKRGMSKRYVEALERRCQLLEQVIVRIAPTLDLEAEVGPKFDRNTWDSIKGNATNSEQGPLKRSHKRKKPATSSVTPSVPNVNGTSAVERIILRPPSLPKPQSEEVPEADSSRGQDFGSLVKDLEHGVKRLAIGAPESRYHGDCPHVSVLHTVVRLKGEVEGIHVVDAYSPGVHLDLSKFVSRKWFWYSCPWEYLAYNLPAPSQLKFPPEDLAISLIALCFTKAFVIFPILHRPSFERDVKAGLHRTDINFAKLYLLVCAVGSRFSSDPRVALKAPREPGMEVEIQWRSAGWIFFAQVMAINRPLLQPAALVDLQVTALAALYLEGSGSPYATAWLLVGVGLRAAQDIGVHRKAFYACHRAFEDQMWKRVFWSLIAMERVSSSGLGRAMSFSDEDIDVQLPLEVDDEYFDEAKEKWEQPPGKPSRIAAFNQYVELTGHLARASKKTLPSNLPPPDALWGKDWADATAELDSALTQWYNYLPEHCKAFELLVRWDSTDTDDIHFEQTSCLRLVYHQVQTIIHQPLIPSLFSVHHTAVDTSPSLTICKHAAQSVSRILAVRLQRGLEVPSPCLAITFNSGLLSLLTIWDAKRNEIDVDTTTQKSNIDICVRTLLIAEKRWHIAGFLADVLVGLASVQVPGLQPKLAPPPTVAARPQPQPPQPRAPLHQPRVFGMDSAPGGEDSALSSQVPISTFGGPQDGIAGPFMTPHGQSLSTGWSRPVPAHTSIFGPNLHHYHISGPQSNLGIPVFPGFGADLSPMDPSLQGITGGCADFIGPNGTNPGPSNGSASQEWSWLNDLLAYGLPADPIRFPPVT